MTMDGSRCWPKVVDQGQGKSDCSHPDRKSKRNTPRRWVGGVLRKKVQFHKPNYFWDGEEKNITAITEQRMTGGMEKEEA